MNTRLPNPRLLLRSAALLPLVLTVACVEDVGSGKVAAEVSEPAPAPAPAQVQGDAVPVDTSRSKVHALGAKVTATHPVEFDAWEGTLRLEGDDLRGVDVTIQMDSLRSDADKLTQHLKSGDFFAVDEHPTATFRSSSVTTKAGDGGATHEISGALSLRGVTKVVSFPATITEDGGAISARAEFVIDRQDFGIAYPGKPDDLIQDNVLLTIDLTGAPTQR